VLSYSRWLLAVECDAAASVWILGKEQFSPQSPQLYNSENPIDFIFSKYDSIELNPTNQCTITGSIGRHLCFDPVGPDLLGKVFRRSSTVLQGSRRVL